MDTWTVNVHPVPLRFIFEKNFSSHVCILFILSFFATLIFDKFEETTTMSKFLYVASIENVLFVQMFEFFLFVFIIFLQLSWEESQLRLLYSQSYDDLCHLNLIRGRPVYRRNSSPHCWIFFFNIPSMSIANCDNLFFLWIRFDGLQFKKCDEIFIFIKNKRWFL